MNIKSSVLGLAALGVVACSGCGDDGGDGGEGVEVVEVPAIAADAKATYAQIVLASYEDSLTAAQALDQSLEAFTAAPSEQTLTAARQAWLDSREPYLQTEVYRFYDGPIDNPDDGPEGLLNAWPLDENYIDYTATEPTAGIVNGAEDITAAGLESLNEKDGEKNIATGYHAIEFLLWGQDMSDSGPGDRPFTDYVEDGSGTADNQGRRKLYLNTASELMLTHLQQLVDAWAEGQTNYRAEFEAADDKEAMRRVLTGMIVLSGFETGGERLQTALDSGEQEDEHSCFSDNTHRDMIQDIQGIQNVWRGSYTRLDGSTVSGAGIRDVIEAVDTDLAGQVDAKVDECLALANALQTPFDQEIKPGADGNARVQSLVVALNELDALLQTVFQTFGLEIPEVE